MKNILKSSLFIGIVLVTFSCKEKPIEKPDSLTPVEVTIADINTGNYNDQTVMINDVYFVDNSGKFNDSGSNSGGSKDITDCSGNTLIVFTYSTDDWAYEEIPDGMGPIYGVVSEYNGDKQLLMRSIDDVAEMTKPVCSIVPVCTAPNTCASGYFCDDFEGGSLSGNNCWTVIDVVNNRGSEVWTYDSFSGDNFAEGSGYNYDSSTDTECDSWLVSRSVNLSSSSAPKLSFSTTANYLGPDVEVYISTTYDGSGTISMGDWTKLSGFSLSTGGFAEVASGNVDISAYKSTTTYVAFRYVSVTGDAGTWQIDDVSISE